MAAVVFGLRAAHLGGGDGRFSRYGVDWRQRPTSTGPSSIAAGSNRFGRGGWRTDYPGADNNFSVRLAELTRVRRQVRRERQPHPSSSRSTIRCSIAVRCSSWKTSVRRLLRTRCKRLREYFLKGGFLWVDDSWGSRAWNNWVQQIGRVLPPAGVSDGRHQSHSPDHADALRREEVPQVPTISYWARSGGETSERGRDSARCTSGAFRTPKAG